MPQNQGTHFFSRVRAFGVQTVASDMEDVAKPKPTQDRKHVGLTVVRRKYCISRNFMIWAVTAGDF